MSISISDREFIEKLLADELDYELLEVLDQKLLDPNFKRAYEAAIEAKYNEKKGQLIGYVPMIVLLTMIVIGVLLILQKL